MALFLLLVSMTATGAPLEILSAKATMNSQYVGDISYKVTMTVKNVSDQVFQDYVWFYSFNDNVVVPNIFSDNKIKVDLQPDETKEFVGKVSLRYFGTYELYLWSEESMVSNGVNIKFGTEVGSKISAEVTFDTNVVEKTDDLWLIDDSEALVNISVTNSGSEVFEWELYDAWDWMEGEEFVENEWGRRIILHLEPGETYTIYGGTSLYFGRNDLAYAKDGEIYRHRLTYTTEAGETVILNLSPTMKVTDRSLLTLTETSYSGEGVRKGDMGYELSGDECLVEVTLQNSGSQDYDGKIFWIEQSYDQYMDPSSVSEKYLSKIEEAIELPVGQQKKLSYTIRRSTNPDVLGRYFTIWFLRGDKERRIFKEEIYFDESTGIRAAKTKTDGNQDVIYDLNGRRIARPTKGINIINGRKVVMK